MSSSIVIDLVFCGTYGYTNHVPCDESDPLNILIAEEEADDGAPSGFVSQADVIAHHQLETRR